MLLRPCDLYTPSSSFGQLIHSWYNTSRSALFPYSCGMKNGCELNTWYQTTLNFVPFMWWLLSLWHSGNTFCVFDKNWGPHSHHSYFTATSDHLWDYETALNINIIILCANLIKEWVDSPRITICQHTHRVCTYTSFANTCILALLGTCYSTSPNKYFIMYT